MSAGLIQFNEMRYVDMGLIAFQGLLTLAHFVLVFRFRGTYFVQVRIEDYEGE